MFVAKKKNENEIILKVVLITNCETGLLNYN